MSEGVEVLVMVCLYSHRASCFIKEAFLRGVGGGGSFDC